MYHILRFRLFKQVKKNHDLKIIQWMMHLVMGMKQKKTKYLLFVY